MEPQDFKNMREEFGFSAAEWGLALGYTGKRANIRQTIMRYESGERPIPPIVVRLANMYDLFGVPKEFDPSPRR